jgi:hypothetical protein
MLSNLNIPEFSVIITILNDYLEVTTQNLLLHALSKLKNNAVPLHRYYSHPSLLRAYPAEPRHSRVANPESKKGPQWGMVSPSRNQTSEDMNGPRREWPANNNNKAVMYYCNEGNHMEPDDFEDAILDKLRYL